MSETSSDFRDALQELIETSPEPAEHPAAERWIAYHRGELSAGEEERLQEHLARCRDCFDLSEAAAAFAGEEEPDAAQEVETAAVWRLLRPQLGPSPDEVRALSGAAPPQTLRPSPKRRLPPYALAASFLVALAALTAWNLQLRSVNEDLRAPRANTPIFDFAAVERDPVERERTVPAGPGMLVFHPEERPVYRLVIRDAVTGGAVSSLDGLRPDEDLALTLYLPQGLPPGRYRIEISDGAGKVVETHLLRVTAADRED